MFDCEVSTEELMLMHMAGESATEVMVEARDRLSRLRKAAIGEARGAVLEDDRQLSFPAAGEIRA